MTTGEPSDTRGRLLPREPVHLRGLLLGGPASLLCAPLVAETAKALGVEAAQVAARGPDLVEWRADYLQGLAPEAVLPVLAMVRERLEVPILFTCRAAFEGGGAPMPEPRRVEIVEAALHSGLVDMVDLELATAARYRDRLLTLARGKGVPVVLSFHRFQATPEEAELLRILAAEQESGASVAKLATMATTPMDGLRLLSACARARREFLRIPLIGIAMGPAGVFTRVLGPLFGVDLTFASAVKSSAPGQLDLDEARQARRLLGVY